MIRYALCPTLFATLNLIFCDRQNIDPCWNVRPDIKYKKSHFRELHNLGSCRNITSL